MNKKFKDWIVFQFNTLWNTFHFWQKRREADRMHILTGKQYFVVPKDRTSLMVVNNDYIGWYNRMASKANGVKKITHPDLLRMCYYKTECGTYKR